jgi:ElaB/YqjD/DUF883 family membrane-anchored ribosome-binding protein
VSWA